MNTDFTLSLILFFSFSLSLCINWKCKLLIWTTLLSLYSRWCQLIPINVCLHYRWQRIMQHENYNGIELQKWWRFLIYFYAKLGIFSIGRKVLFINDLLTIYTKEKKTLSILLARYSSIFLQIHSFKWFHLFFFNLTEFFFSRYWSIAQTAGFHCDLYI